MRQTRAVVLNREVEVGKAISHAKVGELKPQYPIQGVTYRSAEYARTQVDLGNWLDITIGDSLRRAARATPDKVAVIDPDGSVRFAELDATERVRRRQPLGVRAEAR